MRKKYMVIMQMNRKKTLGIGDQLEEAAEVMSLKQLLESVKTEIQVQLEDGGKEMSTLLLRFAGPVQSWGDQLKI